MDYDHWSFLKKDFLLSKDYWSLVKNVITKPAAKTILTKAQTRALAD